MNPFRKFRKPAATFTGVALFTALMLGLIWADVYHQLQESRGAAIRAAVQRNNNLVVSLEQYALRTVLNADALLQESRYEFDEENREPDVVRLLQRGVIDAQIIDAVFVADERGRVRSSSKPDTAAVSLAGEPYFEVHKAGSDELYISTPLRSRINGNTVLVLSRRLTHPDGSFAGTVSVQVLPRTFTRFYAHAALRTYDLISLIAPNGITYARRRGDRESEGEDISKSPLFIHVARNPVGSYFAKDAIHHIPTYFSYRKLEGYPIIATVGSSEADVMAVYFATARRECWFGLILSVLLLLFSGTVLLLFRQRRRGLRAMQAAQALRRREQERHQRQLTQQIIEAQERERENIGRELHDNVNQVLTTVKLNIELAQSEPTLTAGLLQRSVTYLQQCISGIRQLSRDLSAPTLGTRSIIDSIAALVEMVGTSSGIHIGFRYESYHTAIPLEQKLALYRILQEALTNIGRYSGATMVDVELDQSGGYTRLCVTDNGRGFDPNAKRAGIGLTNMRSRATVLGGTLQIRSAPGQGCHIAVRLPMTINNGGIDKTGEPD